MFEQGIVEKILLGVGGLTVVGLTEMIKRFFNLEGLWAYVLSAVVSAAATAYFLLSGGGFAWIPFVGYTIFVFLVANGIYKTIAKT